MLKLLALDEEDLAVFSFHLQQAHLCPHEILWQAEQKRFLAPLRRFDWDTALSRAGHSADKTAKASLSKTAADFQLQEIAAILHCECVLSVRSYGMKRAEKQNPLTLKGLCFKPSAALAGILEFLFHENAGLRLELECIEMKLTDLSA